MTSSFSTCSGYTSTHSQFDNRLVLPSLQRVEAELDALATCQQQGSRDIKELREDIRGIKEDLNSMSCSPVQEFTHEDPASAISIISYVTFI